VCSSKVHAEKTLHIFGGAANDPNDVAAEIGRASSSNRVRRRHGSQLGRFEIDYGITPLHFVVRLRAAYERRQQNQQHET
jgi:hypothetical protein